jgi:hypothetical protein
MVLLEAVLVVGLLGLISYVTILLLTGSGSSSGSSSGGSSGGGRTAAGAGHWVTVHYDTDGETCVAVTKVSTDGAGVLDEHIVARIPVADPDYDDKFIAAMAVARERQALFEAEEG